MKVELLDVMGDDLAVANAARVSYGKHHTEFQDNDKRLLHYLANHNHFSPFTHPQLSFRVSASIAVARQLFRHQVGLTVNEVSRRYVNDPPTFDLPDVWRSAPGVGQSKQGSGEPLDAHTQGQIRMITDHLFVHIESAYNVLIQNGVAPEQARLVLPMALTTEFYWTGSLMAFIRVCQQRLKTDAQQETFYVILEVYKHLKEHFPESVKAWNLDKDIVADSDAI